MPTARPRGVDLRIFKIEQELATLDKRKHEIVNLLQEEATYADAAQFRVLSAELEAVETKIPKFTTEWEKATEELEKLVPVDSSSRQSCENGCA